MFSSFSYLATWAVILAYWMACSNAKQSTHFKHYETLSRVKVLSSVVKRSSPTDGELTKTVFFRAFHKNFHLTLKSGSPVLPSNFRARLVHLDGTSTTFPIDESKIFIGHLTYEPRSQVHAHIADSLWTIHIFQEKEAYGVEPAWRLLNATENPRNDTMVAYRMSDLKHTHDRQKFCGVPNTENNTESPHESDHSSHLYFEGNAPPYSVHLERERRRSRPRKNTCLMYLVGDSDLFNKRCKRNHVACSALMIQYSHIANGIFRKTPFESTRGRKLTGYGIQVAELVLHTDYNTEKSRFTQARHFNQEFKYWSADTKLQSFATYMKLSNKRYCLNHLFTEFSDTEGVLGLAYVDQICRWTGRRESYNSGITSGTNRQGLLLPTLTAGLVLAHEVGHNFGSNHDPDTEECAPEDYDGGKYLMWRFAVSGAHVNNKIFSKCSKREIGRGIPAHCFVHEGRKNDFCGNGIVERGEECDAGFLGINDGNKCCSKYCKLRRGAKCSEVNHECCVNCQIAAPNTVCHDTRTSHNCYGHSYCSGYDNTCIQGKPLKDGTVCGEMHECHNGKCLDPCELKSLHEGGKLEPCLCKKNATEGCMWCCYDASTTAELKECKPILPEPRHDDTECYMGFCKEGVCTPNLEQHQTRLSSYIQFVQESSLEKLLKTNIVLVTVVVSLVLWIPPSIWVHCNDLEEKRVRDMLEEIFTTKEEEEEDEESDDDDESAYVWRVKREPSEVKKLGSAVDLLSASKGEESTASSQLEPSVINVAPQPLKGVLKTGSKLKQKQGGVKLMVETPTPSDTSSISFKQKAKRRESCV